MGDKQNKPGNEEDVTNDPVEQGKKAIEAEKKVQKQDKPEHQKDKEEKQDAENWRNEG